MAKQKNVLKPIILEPPILQSITLNDFLYKREFPFQELEAKYFANLFRKLTNERSEEEILELFLKIKELDRYFDITPINKLNLKEFKFKNEILNLFKDYLITMYSNSNDSCIEARKIHNPAAIDVYLDIIDEHLIRRNDLNDNNLYDFLGNESKKDIIPKIKEKFQNVKGLAMAKAIFVLDQENILVYEVGSKSSKSRAALARAINPQINMSGVNKHFKLMSKEIEFSKDEDLKYIKDWIGGL